MNHNLRLSVSLKNLRLCENKLKFLVLIVLLFSGLKSTAAPNAEKSSLEVLADIEIRGTVTDSISGDPLVGVTIGVMGQTVGAVTDARGNFSLTAPENSVLSITAIGYKPKQVSVNGRAVINVVLSKSVAGLEEVVVVGFGEQKKITVTGALSTVSSTELKQSPTPNVSNMMVGKLPGLIATQHTGAPGFDQSKIRIRGISTYAGSIGSRGGSEYKGNSSEDALILVDGIQVFDFNDLDPSEIEDITILKDASATAVYGVRGANGVVLITTKRGNLGKPKISITSDLTAQSPAELRKLENSYYWALTGNEARKYDAYLDGVYTPRWSDEELQKFKDQSDPIFYPSTDWLDLMVKDISWQTRHNINVRGGTEHVRYFVSGSYFNQFGLLNDKLDYPDYLQVTPQMKNKRYNFRTNLDFDVTKYLQVSLNGYAKLQTFYGASQGVTHDPEMIGYYFEVLNSNPVAASPGIVDGKIIENPGFVTTVNPNSNPIVTLLGGMNEMGLETRYIDDVGFDVAPKLKLDFLTEGLSVRGQISYKSWKSDRWVHSNEIVTHRPVRLEDSSINFIPNVGKEGAMRTWTNVAQNRRGYAEFAINYNRLFGDHSVSGMLLYNQGKDHDPNLQFDIPHAYQGFAGRLAYSYKDTYMAEFNAGYNGTENFAKGRRFGFFPAYSIGWVPSNESFFPKNDILSFIKIRASHGEVGNDRIGGQRFLYLPGSYNMGGTYHFGAVGSDYTSYTIINEGIIGNPNLRWEVAKKSDVGVDVRMFKDRLTVTADWFYEKRSNILSTLGVTPATVGATLPAQNIGRVQNMGVDGEFLYSDKVGKVNYSLGGNYTYTHNKILYMAEAPAAEPYQQFTGHAIGSRLAFITEGFYNSWEETIEAYRPVSDLQGDKEMPGNFRLKDVNGDGVIDRSDYVFTGRPSFPAVSYAINFSAEYNGFYMVGLFQGATEFSSQVPKVLIRRPDDRSTSTFYKDKTWSPERVANGDDIWLPHPTLSRFWINNQDLGNWNYEDNTFIRLRNLELGYRFNKDMLQPLGISSLRVYVNGNNLVTWHRLFPGEYPDVETFSDGDYEPYPITRSFNFGIEVQF